jgi:hypothetical protein
MKLAGSPVCWRGSTGGVAATVPDRRAELLAQLRQGPGEEARQAVAVTPTTPVPSRWTLRTIRATFSWLQDYGLSGVWRLLRRCKLTLRSAHVQHYSPDPDYAVKEAELLRYLRTTAQARTERVVLFLDEMGYYRWPQPAPAWGPAAPLPPPTTMPTGTNTQWRIVGALNALTGQVDYLDDYIVGRKQLINFYGRLAQRYADMEYSYVVQDNWSIHHHADVLTALQHWPQIVPVWLPTYAPWLNPIEKLWRWLRQDLLKLHRHAGDWPAMRHQVRSFLDQFRHGSHDLLHYVGLQGEGKVAQALRYT